MPSTKVEKPVAFHEQIDTGVMTRSIDEIILVDEEEEEQPHAAEEMIQPQAKPKVETPRPREEEVGLFGRWILPTAI